MTFSFRLRMGGFGGVLLTEDGVGIPCKGGAAAGKQDAFAEVFKIMCAEREAFYVLDLLVQSFRRTVRLMIPPCVLNAFPALLNTGCRLPDGRTFTGEISVNPFCKGSTAGCKRIMSNDVIEVMQGSVGGFKFRSNGKDTGKSFVPEISFLVPVTVFIVRRCGKEPLRTFDKQTVFFGQTSLHL